MIDLLLVPVAIVYMFVVGALFIYGINFFYLTYLAWRDRNYHTVKPEIDQWPTVTVQLPIYNEMYVAERLIDAVAGLEYPRDSLEIQVLDDSTDQTVQIAHHAVERVKANGVKIDIIRRSTRKGYKAGALAEGLKHAEGEFIVIFDADFIPQPAFLKQTIPHFYSKDNSDPRPIAFIQTRWGHVNRDYSFLTLLQSLAIDAHFMVEQFARMRGGFWFNFNGTAGVWRREAIEAAGGWRADTLTEDLDLSYRAFLNGWRALYLRDIVVPAELPVSISAYRRQQHRWARGSLECAIKLIPQVWQAPISISKKIGATLHLTGYGVHILLFSLTLLYPLVLVLSQQYPALISLFGIALIFNATAFAPTIFFLAAQQLLGRKWYRVLPNILFISSLGAGMMVNTLRAAWEIVVGTSAKFERTPKFGIAEKGQDWTHRIYQLRLDPLVFIELALAAVNAVTAIIAISFGNWMITIYAAIFCIGLLFTSGITIAQALSVHRKRLEASRPPLGVAGD